MTGFESKRNAAQAKLTDDAQGYIAQYEAALLVSYQSGFADGKRSAEQQAEPVAYDKTAMNSFVIDLYDSKMKEGKHGHYETMFHVVHQAIKKVAPPQRPWQGLEIEEVQDSYNSNYQAQTRAIEAKLKERNT